MARNLFAEEAPAGRNLFAESPVDKGATIGEILSKNSNISFYQERLSGDLPGDVRRKFQGELDKEIKKSMAMEELRSSNPYLAETIEDMSSGQIAGVGFQRGLRDVARGAGDIIGQDLFAEEPTEALDALESVRPKAEIARIGGQAAPFMVPGAAISQVSSMPARAGLMSGLGGVEGATISAGTGGDAGDILLASGLGAIIGPLSEVSVPVVNRVLSKIKGPYTDQFGRPTPETIKAFGDEGVDIDDIRMTAGERASGQERFDQLKREQFLLEQSGDAGDIMRQEKLLQSQEIEGFLDSIPKGETVDRAQLGESLKEAIELRKNSALFKRKMAYDTLAEVSSEIDLDLSTAPFKELDIDAGMVRDFHASNPQASRLKNLLSEFGVAVEGMPVDPDMFAEPLTVANSERFRKRLNRIDSADQTGESKLFTGPIREALDEEFDTAARALIANGSDDVARAAKEARLSHIALKSEFDEKGIVDQLIAPKVRGSNIPKVEDSQVYSKIVAPSMPIEQVESLIGSLGKAGSRGKRARNDLGSQMVMDLMDSAFSAKTRKINGERVFGATAFSNRYDALEPKLKAVLSKEQFKKLSDFRAKAEDLIPPSGATPKGSAGFFIDALNTAGLLPLLGSFGVPGEALSGWVKKTGQQAKNMKDVRKAIDPPADAETFIANEYPALGAALGVTLIAQE